MLYTTQLVNHPNGLIGAVFSNRRTVLGEAADLIARLKQAEKVPSSRGQGNDTSQ